MAQLVLKQLLAGRDFGRDHPVAGQMQNFVYIIGDADVGVAMLVDPAWAVDDLLDQVRATGLRLVGVIATHTHADHIGGDLYGFRIEGVADLIAKAPCPIHVHQAEEPRLRTALGSLDARVHTHEDGDIVRVGDIEVRLLHTPGHTPGSQCLLVDGAIVAGDTLFVQGCGRVDLPGGDVDQMFTSLTERLADIPDDFTLYPGHAYSGPSADMGTVRRTNPVLQVHDRDTWRRMMRS